MLSNAITGRKGCGLPAVTSWTGDAGIPGLFKTPTRSVQLPRKTRVGQDNALLEHNENAYDRLRDTIAPYARGVNPMVSVQMSNSGGAFQQQPQQRLPYQLKSFRPPIVKREYLEPLSRQHRNATNIKLLPSYRTFEKQDRSTPVTWRQPTGVSVTVYRTERPKFGDESRTQQVKLAPVERVQTESKRVPARIYAHVQADAAATRTVDKLRVPGKIVTRVPARPQSDEKILTLERNVPAVFDTRTNRSSSVKPQAYGGGGKLATPNTISYSGLQTRLPILDNTANRSGGVGIIGRDATRIETRAPVSSNLKLSSAIQPHLSGRDSIMSAVESNSVKFSNRRVPAEITAPDSVRDRPVSKVSFVNR